MNSLWLSINGEAARRVVPESVEQVAQRAFPRFETLPNELPSACRARWKAEFKQLGVAQHRHVQDLVCNVYFAHCKLSELRQRINAWSTELQMIADWTAAERILGSFTFRVFTYTMTDVSEISVEYQLAGSAVTTKLVVSPLSPSEQLKI